MTVNILVYTDKDYPYFWELDSASKFVMSLEDMICAYCDKRNNYVVTDYRINVYDDGIRLSSSCTNEYGSEWSNEDDCFVPKRAIRNIVARHLYL